ncbi:hypothetical protein Tsubulata_048466 [Turnera subulata]|uniref:Uncharacterized protein n=1 Tax=Turnera subulata TaxID=218843 RepID=A0A9Q0FW01_9ROSI|nr:hypothetical protein Tsubulata_048466 [Turnera subulata]
MHSGQVHNIPHHHKPPHMGEVSTAGAIVPAVKPEQWPSSFMAALRRSIPPPPPRQQQQETTFGILDPSDGNLYKEEVKI